MGIGVLDADGRIEPATHGLSVWLPDGDLTAMDRWKQGGYHLSRPIPDSGGLRVVVERSAEPVVLAPEAQHLSMFTMLLIILLTAIAASVVLSRWISRPLTMLDHASGGLAARIAAGNRPSLPDSSVEEYASLSTTLAEVAGQLADSFHELHQALADLESGGPRPIAGFTPIRRVARWHTRRACSYITTWDSPGTRPRPSH